MIKETIYIILDLEATCYNRNDKNAPEGFQNEIIEIGAVKMDSNGQFLDEFQSFVKPIKFPLLSDFCTNLTTIKQEDVDTAHAFNQVLFRFKEWAGYITNAKNIKWVSWGHYDRKQFQMDCLLHGMDPNWITENNHISIKHMHAEWNNLNKGLGLGKACKKEGLQFIGTAHRGIDDAKMIAKIAYKYLPKLSKC